MIVEPQRTVFVILSFEGPDVYSQAGGLGVRVKGLARSLAQLGYQTCLYFCGDPDLPGEESHESGRLVYRRWCQWISSRHRGGVYDGEEEKIHDGDPEAVADLKLAAAADHFCFKIGRFDPDKRWLMAVSAAGYIKRHGRRVRLLLRGGREPHGGEVISHAQHQGLNIVHVNAPPEPAGLSAILRRYPDADVVNLTSYVSDPMLGVIYPACDAVLANSGHEPFGLVGLEVMAAGGLAVTGATGEDYADAYRNALVLETDDAIELVTALS